MKSNPTTIPLLLVSLVGCAYTTTPTTDNTQLTTYQSLLIIGQDKETISSYIQETGLQPNGFMVYTSLKNLEGLDEPTDYGSGIQHASYFVNLYPGSYIQIGLYLVGSINEINAGSLDSNIQRFARWCKQANTPILLRIGYEFDYPSNNYAPKQYTLAFRRVVDGFRKERVSNVSFVWHSAAVAKKPEQWYPGDSYVDWCAVSFFDPSNVKNMQIVGDFAKSHNKPLMIAESTPRGYPITQGERSWKGWFEPFFDFIEQNNVKIISYINSDWERLAMFKNQGWPDARIQDNDYIKSRWLHELKKREMQQP